MKMFDCDDVRSVWHNLYTALNFVVEWKQIVIGFHLETNPKVLFYNTIVSYLSFKIYEMGCSVIKRLSRKFKIKTICLKLFI